MANSYKHLKAACYTTNISMSVVTNLSPLLFIIFRNLYGFSYSLLGLLVLINFCTQLLIDLAFSFFSHKFNISLSVRLTPVLTVLGLLIYAVMPFFAPNLTYLWIVIGTVVFSTSGGLAEVLISPVIAAIPAKDPDREMSKLHSIYAWGVVGVVIFGTLFLYLCKEKSWQYLALVFAIVPLISSILFCITDVPEVSTPKKTSSALKMFKEKGVWLCVLAIFFGGASECTMGQWCSGYLEQSFQIPKMLGDVCGVTLFAASLGLGRTLYSKIGKNLGRVLLFGAIGAAVCYIVSALVPVAIVGLIACALCGFCVAMLWPGTLVYATEKYKNGGVFMFAIMAAGGDFGASVGPQLVGVISDGVIASAWANNFATTLGITIEQLAMKCAMLSSAIFPIIAVILFAIIYKDIKKRKQSLISIEKQAN